MANNVEPKPCGEEFPDPVSFLCRPSFETPRTRNTFGKLGTLQLAQLLRNIQRISTPFLSVKDVMLRGEIDEFRKVFAAGCGGDAYFTGFGGGATTVGGDSWVESGGGGVEEGCGGDR